MVSENFLLDVEEVIERGLPPRKVKVQSLPAIVLFYEGGIGWKVHSAIRLTAPSTVGLKADQLVIFTTPESIQPHLRRFRAPPDQTSTTTMATLLLQDEVADAIADLLDVKFGARGGRINISEAVQQVGRRSQITQL